MSISILLTMGYRYINVNPRNLYVEDCVIRSIALSERSSWDDIFMDLSVLGLDLCDKVDSNYVWQTYLKRLGYRKVIILNSYKNNFTIADFCRINSKCEGLLGTGSHLVYVRNGNYYDNWDCGSKVPIWFFTKGDF